MSKNDNYKYIGEQYRNGDIDFLQDWVDAVREDAPDEAQWQTARRNLSAKLQSKTKENLIMRIIQNSQPKGFRWATAATVMVLLAAAVAVGLFNRGSNLAFAEVLEHIRSVKTLSFTNTVNAPSNPPELQTVTFKTDYMEPGKQRTIQDNGNIIVMDMAARKSMSLIPSQKKGMIFDFSKMPQQEQQVNFIESLQNLQDQADMVLGQKNINGKLAMGFFVNQAGQEYTIWADIKTGLPMIIEVKMAMFGNMKVTMTDFVFNPDLDESLFAIQLPEGYEEIKMPDMNVGEPTENDLIETLRIYSENTKTFPDSLTLQDIAKGLGGKIGNGEPSEEDIQEFTAQFIKLQQGTLFYQMNAGNDWHYEPKGVNPGDKNPLCWWKPQGSETYRVVYGDLSIADVSPEDFVKEN